MLLRHGQGFNIYRLWAVGLRHEARFRHVHRGDAHAKSNTFEAEGGGALAAVRVGVGLEKDVVAE